MNADQWLITKYSPYQSHEDWNWAYGCKVNQLPTDFMCVELRNSCITVHDSQLRPNYETILLHAAYQRVRHAG